MSTYQQKWESMNLSIIKYVKNEKFRGLILSDLTEVFQLLEDNGMNLQSMAGSQLYKYR